MQVPFKQYGVVNEAFEHDNGDPDPNVTGLAEVARWIVEKVTCNCVLVDDKAVSQLT